VLERGSWKQPSGRGTLAPSQTNSGASDPMAVPLVVASAPVVPNRPALPGQLTLGRGATCDITLGEATVSQVHLLFMEAGPRVWTVRDANSRNGTWVGEQRLEPGRPAVLRDGEILRVGQVRLTFHTPDGFFARLRMLAHRMTPTQQPQAT